MADRELQRQRLVQLLRCDVSNTPRSSSIRSVQVKRELLADEAAEQIPQPPQPVKQPPSFSQLAMMLHSGSVNERVISPGSYMTLKTPKVKFRNPAYTAGRDLPPSRERPWTRASRSPCRLPTRGSQGSSLSGSTPPLLTPSLSPVRSSPRNPPRPGYSPRGPQQTALAQLSLPPGLRGLAVDNELLFSYRYSQGSASSGGEVAGCQEEGQEEGDGPQEWTDTRYLQLLGTQRQSAFEFVNKLQDNRLKQLRVGRALATR